MSSNLLEKPLGLTTAHVIVITLGILAGHLIVTTWIYPQGYNTEPTTPLHGEETTPEAVN